MTTITIKTYPGNLPIEMIHTDLPSEIADKITACARGQYQRWLLDGREKWSGASLRGRAREYGARYAESRSNLLSRIHEALDNTLWAADVGLVLDGPVGERRWRRELVIIGPGGVHIF